MVRGSAHGMFRPVTDTAATEPPPGAIPSASPASEGPVGPVGPNDGMPRWVPRAILLALGAVVVFFFGWWVLRELRTLIIMVFVALFLSLAMEPAVAHLA